MKNKYLYTLIIFLLGFTLGVTSLNYFMSKDYKEEIELTSEMKEYADKLDEKGYLTEDDLKEMRKIQKKHLKK